MQINSIPLTPVRQAYSPAIRFGGDDWKPADIEDILGPEPGETQQPGDTVEKQKPEPTGPITDPKDVKQATEDNYLKAESILKKLQDASDYSQVANYELRMKRVNAALERFQKRIETDPRQASIKRYLEENPDKLWDIFAQADPLQAQELMLIGLSDDKSKARTAKEAANAEMRVAMSEAAQEAREAAKRAATATVEAAGKAAKAVGETIVKAPGAIVEGVAKTREYIDEVKNAAKIDKTAQDDGLASETTGSQEEKPAEQEPDLSPPADPPAPAEGNLRDKARDFLSKFRRPKK